MKRLHFIVAALGAIGAFKFGRRLGTMHNVTNVPLTRDELESLLREVAQATGLKVQSCRGQVEHIQSLGATDDDVRRIAAQIIAEAKKSRARRVVV